MLNIQHTERAAYNRWQPFASFRYSGIILFIPEFIQNSILQKQASISVAEKAEVVCKGVGIDFAPGIAY